MELTLNIYKDFLCRELEKTVTAEDFELSTGICEDLLDVINIDMFEGGLSALSEESAKEMFLPIIKNGYPFIIRLIKEIFQLTDDEAKKIKLSDIVSVVMKIVTYSITQLANSLGVKEKN